MKKIAVTLILLSTSVALAQSAGFELDAQSGVTYGRGYDSHRKDFFKTCVKVTKKSPKEEAGQPTANSSFELVTSNSQVVDKMNLSVGASFSALIGGGKLSLSSKNDLVAGTDTNQYNLSLLASAYSYDKPKFLKLEKLSLLPEYQKLLDDGKKDEFKAECGDSFVYGIREGREFFGTVRVDKQDLKSWSKFNTDNSISYENAQIQAKVDVGFEKSLEKTFGANNLKVNARSAGVEGIKNPKSLEELQDIFSRFNKLKGGGADIKLYLVSYASLPGVKAEDPLDLKKITVQQGYLVSALWDLKAMQADADFILHNREMFALGTIDAKKNKRFADVEKLKKRWSDEFWDLQDATKACMEDFTKKCENLADKYNRRSAELVAERKLLPDRYTSDCYSDVWVDGDKDVGDVLFRMPLQLGVHDRGDATVGQVNVRTASWLRVKPDGRMLKAQYEAVVEEWADGGAGKRRVDNNDWLTRYHAITPLTQIFSLDDMRNANLKECDYVGIGVQNPVYGPDVDGSWDRNTGAANPFVYSNKDPVAGYTAYLFPPPIPWNTLKHITEGQKGGALSSMNCVLAAGDNDDNKLTCEKPDMQNLKLGLVNSLDKKADNWAPAALENNRVPKIGSKGD